MDQAKANPPWHQRLGKLIQECFDFIGTISTWHRERVAVRGVPIRDGDYRIVYRYGYRGELLPDDIIEDFRDILARARSVLDIAMFTAVKTAASPPLSEKEERNTYFPIASTEASWKSMAGQPHLKALSQDQRDALRAIQPFATGNPVISEFAKIHNDDKHQSPLQLAVRADPEFAMLFHHPDPLPGKTREWWIDWVEPAPPIENRVAFVEYRSLEPIRSAGLEDVPIALAVQVGDEWRDVQHLLWDVLEFVERASAILHDGDTALADAFKAILDGEREQLAAYNKMMVTGDPAAEQEWMRLAGMVDEAGGEK